MIRIFIMSKILFSPELAEPNFEQKLILFTGCTSEWKNCASCDTIRVNFNRWFLNCKVAFQLFLSLLYLLITCKLLFVILTLLFAHLCFLLWSGCWAVCAAYPTWEIVVHLNAKGLSHPSQRFLVFYRRCALLFALKLFDKHHLTAPPPFA